MRLTNMKFKNKKLNSEKVNALLVDLHSAFKSAGFITEMNVVNSQCIKIGQRMRSFSINLAKHGYNTQHSIGQMRLTNLPTWEQRVIYNNIINNVLDLHQISCNIKSGPYIIRKGFTVCAESDWEVQKPEWQSHNESLGFYIEAGNYKLSTKGA